MPSIRTTCPFCDLDSEKTRTIRKGKLSTIILSNPRLMPGHTLVIPNRHVEEPWTLTDEELLAISADITFVQTQLLKELATGCDVRQNYRPFIPQGRVKIDHVHFHVLPRTSEDELFQKSMRFERELFLDLPADERDRIVSLLKA